MDTIPFGLSLVLFCTSPSLSYSASLAGRVVGVADGDTVTLLDSGNGQHKIRVAGIDSPEKRQSFGDRAKQSMSRMVFGKSVQVEWEKKDRYGRIIGKILVSKEDCQKNECPKNFDVGLAQIVFGLAWHYKKYERDQSEDDRKNYAQSEVSAKTKKIGLWSEGNPIAPWDFRHHK